MPRRPSLYSEKRARERGLPQCLRVPGITPGDTVIVKHGRRLKVARLMALIREPGEAPRWRIFGEDGRSVTLDEVLQVEEGEDGSA